jgi:hypothetical protein
MCIGSLGTVDEGSPRIEGSRDLAMCRRKPGVWETILDNRDVDDVGLR